MERFKERMGERYLLKACLFFFFWTFLSVVISVFLFNPAFLYVPSIRPILGVYRSLGFSFLI